MNENTRQQNTFFSSIPTHAYLLSHIKGKCNNLKLNLVYAKRGVNKVCMGKCFCLRHNNSLFNNGEREVPHLNV